MKWYERAGFPRFRFNRKKGAKSLYKRQFALIAGIVLFTLSLLGIAFFAISYNYTIQEKEKSMLKNAEQVGRLYAYYLTADDPMQAWDFRILISATSSVADSDILISTTDGQILFGSGNGLQQDLSSKSIPASVTSLVTSGKHYAAKSDLGGIYTSKRFVVGIPILHPKTGEVMGLSFAAADTSVITKMWRAFLTIFSLTALVVFLLAFISSSIASRQMTQPLKEMAEATTRFARGEFKVRVPNYGRQDEIDELAMAFNAMAESLEQSENRRREFIANISHELKTPMTTISGYTDGILDGTIPKERETEYLKIISEESRRLSRLVRRMLDLSQLQSGELMKARDRFDISEVMRRVLVSMEHKINGRGLDVETALPEEPVFVLGDQDMITQVVYNLLDNAIKFAAAGSALRLALSVRGDTAYVSVRNRGETISPDELPLLFERFHKTDRSRSMDRDGVGLGLYIVKTILNQHHQNITVTSENGVTEFTFTLGVTK